MKKKVTKSAKLSMKEGDGMGFGIIAIACICMLSPIGGGWYISSVSFSFIFLLYLLIFLGIYVIQRRIQSPWLHAGIWGCGIFAALVLLLAEDDARILTNILGPWLFLAILQGSKCECSEKTKNQIHRFMMCFLIWYGCIAGFRIFGPIDDLFTTYGRWMLICLVLLQLVITLWLFYLCLRINRELKGLEMIRRKEYVFPRTLRNTTMMLCVAPICLVVLYGLQGPYMRTILQQQPNLPQTILFEGMQEDAYLTGSGYQSSVTQTEKEISIQELVLSLKDMQILSDAYTMEQHIYMDGNRKASIAKTTITKENNRIAFDEVKPIDFLMIQKEQLFKVEVVLYDQQDQLLYQNTFPLQVDRGVAMHAKSEGITLHDLWIGKGQILRTPNVEFSLSTLQHLRQVDQLAMQVHFYKEATLVHSSAVIKQEIDITSTYLNGESRLWMLSQDWSTILLSNLYYGKYDQANIELTFIEQGNNIETITFPLEVTP